MAGNAIIGALRVVLGLDTAQYDEGLKSSIRKLNTAGNQFKKIGADMAAIGASMSLALTMPLAAMGVATAKSAGDFESAMNRVSIATQASAKDLAALEAKALKTGKTSVYSANQAAGAMESLAKAGVSTRDILDGAADATINLAAAAGSELDPAASAISDTLSQFKLTAESLPAVVDQITGAVNESKLSFEDYQLAMGQVGGVAGSAGVEFADFNAVLAGTSSMFASGSDAGTSFKTFLQSLGEKSEKATATMKALGLSFYAADGSLKSMSEIAQQLQDKLGGLSEQARNKALTEIFGADAMRTAIGLMNLGADGLDRIKAKIAETDAAAQAAKRIEGFNGQLTQLKNALEGLAIAIGKSGLLEALTVTVTAIGNMAEALSSASPLVLGIGTAIAALVAIVGPAILVLGAFSASIGAILTLSATLTPVMASVGVAFSAMAVRAGVAGAALRAFGVAASVAFGPWGLAIMAIVAALGFLVGSLNKAKVASAEFRAVTDATAKATDAYREAALAAAMATGKHRVEAIKNARAMREEAVQAIAAAKAKMLSARASLAAAKASLANTRAAKNDPTNADYKTRTALGQVEGGLKSRADQAGADLAEAERAYQQGAKQLADSDAIINAFNLPASGGGGGTYTLPDSGAGDASGGKTATELALQREELQLQAKLESARAKNDIAAVQDLEKKLDLRQRISAYEDAGLKKAEAEIAAGRDVATIEKAKADARRRALDDREDEVSLTVAEELGQSKVVDLLERKAEKARLVTWYQEEGLDLAAATARAESDLLRIDQARLKTREKLVAEMAEEHAIELAKARGDSEAEIRALERAAEQRKRAERYERDLKLSPADAAAKAGLELDQEEQARQQGAWRDTIKGAFRAAMDGDLAGFAEDWLKNWAAKGLETALNDIADLLYQLFKSAFSQADTSAAGGGSGGWLNGLINLGVGLFTGGGGSSAGTSAGASIPGFATGGSFKVGGAGQADSKLISMRLTPGEMVDIRKPGNDNGPAGIDGIGIHVTPSPLFQVAVSKVAASASSGAARAAYAQSSADLARTQRSQSRRLGAGS